jgi:chromosome partitioning protein
MIISILNHKGGTGKTTTTINLGKALALRKKTVLLIDLDSQANLSYSLGINAEEKNIGEILFKQCTIKDAVVRREGMDIIPANTNLHQYEEAIIINKYGYYLLEEALQNANYDFILIDCPPSQSQLNINALCASEKVLVPMLMDVLSLQGLNQLLNTINEIKEQLNPKLEILGVLGVLVDERRQLTRDILEHLQKNYPVAVFNNYVRANVKAAEAPSYGLSVLEYAPISNCATDYKSVANELLQIMKN